MIYYIYVSKKVKKRIDNIIMDTDPKIRKIIIDGYRKMTPQQKLQRVNELNKSIQQIALARILKQYGNISEKEQTLRLASLWIDQDIMVNVFNWDPKIKGY